jgi:NADP-dependent 3-hydroxy acid dehydrogenase YdfG
MTRVLVTGAASGIGRAIAEELTSSGYEVLATARKVSRLQSLHVSMRLALDVDDEGSVARAVAAAEPIDVLVNNAGFGVGGPTERVSIPDVRRMFETNVFGALRMIQAVVPAMRDRRRGAIVNISSMTSRFPWPLGGLYAASKAALESIGEALHIELRPFGIRVINVEPGIIRTNLRFLSFGGDEPPYDALQRQWLGIFDRPHPGPEVVGAAVRASLAEGEGRTRIPVGEDASRLLAARREMTDEEFAEELLSMFGIDWSSRLEDA